MSATLLIVATAGAILFAVLIHHLYPGARKQLVVASMKPFGEVTRPRLTFANITEKLLLACRLTLLGALPALLLLQAPSPSSREFDGDVVAIVPGTTDSAWQAMLADGQQGVWLDALLTAVDSDDQPAGGDVVNALLRLDQSLPPAASLTVIGAPSAAEWPNRMPGFSRDIRWLSAPREDVADTSRGLSTALWIVGGEEQLASVVARSTDLWRQAGLLDAAVEVERVPVKGFAWPDAAATIVWLEDEPPPVQRIDHTLITIVQPEHAAVGDVTVVYDPRLAVGVFATRLWQAVGQSLSQPATGADVMPLPSAAVLSSTSGLRIAPRAASTLSPFWLSLIVGLFVLERCLSLQVART